MRKAVVLGGVLTAAVIALVVWRLRDDAPAATPAPAAGRVVDNAAVAQATALANARAKAAAAAPGSQGATPTADGPRDHRTRDIARREGEPVMPPRVPEGRKLSAVSVGGLQEAVRASVRTCTAQFSKADLGPKPRAQLFTTNHITAGQLHVDAVEVRLADVNAGPIEAVTACLQAAVKGAQADAAGEADLEGYAIALNFVVIPGS